MGLHLLFKFIVLSWVQMKNIINKCLICVDLLNYLKMNQSCKSLESRKCKESKFNTEMTVILCCQQSPLIIKEDGFKNGEFSRKAKVLILTAALVFNLYEEFVFSPQLYLASD